MIRIFRKSWMRSRRSVCAALCLVFLSSLLAVPAGADEYLSGDLSVSVYRSNDFLTDVISYPLNASDVNVFVGSLSSSQNSTFIPFRFWFDCNGAVNGSVAIYVSYYFLAHDQVFLTNPSSSFYDSWTLEVDNVDGVSDSYSHVVTNSRFSVPAIDGGVVSEGVALKARVSNYEGIINVDRIGLRSEYYYSGLPLYSFGPGAGSVFMAVPSAALVVGLSSGELDALEGIADGIAAQSQILSSMYGDIMELLNDLYSRLGDMQAVEELTNTYFAQLIPLVNSINTNTANIYSLLQTQFQLLRTLIATESDDIQAAIQQQTEDLKAYFDTVFSGATGDMPEKSDDLDSAVGDFSSAEQDYQSNATQRFDELASTFSGFSGGTLAGVTLASTLFTRVWDALGQYNIVYYFPLLLGLSLVIIGRLSRGSGGQSSSEKHRGDSSA